jgi:small-conductance mechanosensitive channel
MPPIPADVAEAFEPDILKVLAALAFSLAIAFAVSLIARGLMRRFFSSIESDGHLSQMSKAATRLVTSMAFAITLALVAFPALDLAGVELAVGLEGEDLTRWIGRTGLRIGIIVLLTIASSRLVTALIGRAEREVVAGGGVQNVEQQKRAQTLGRTLRGFLTSGIWLIGILMILQALDINIMPVLTGAGIVGLAVGFGAQTLVKDFIAGFFLLLEDQVRVGDVATLNGIGGLVEQINLRTTVLRDLEGIVHVIPNGEIRTLANRTKDYSFAVLDLSIDFDADIDVAIAALERAAEALRQDAPFSSSILEPLEVLGVDDIQGAAVIIRVRFKTVPLHQWIVARAYRRRIQQEFTASGIRIPHQRFAMARDNGDPIVPPVDPAQPRTNA